MSRAERMMNTAVVATIRDSRGKVAEFVARRGPDEIQVDLVLTARGNAYREDFAPLAHGTVVLLNNGVVYLRRKSDQTLVDVTHFLQEISHRRLKLTYNAAGTEQAYEMIRQIALHQPATEPFSCIVDSLNQRLTELGLPHVGN